MDACGCDDFASIFDRRTAEKDRDRYRRKGPDRTTRMLLDLIGRHPRAGTTLLDIGGGVGVVDRELLRSGVGHAVLVDASRAYLDVARQEARRENLLDRLEMVDGDFVRRAAEIDRADIVTLDRVVCCYADAGSLVSLSAAKANHVYGLVLPRDRWIIRIGLGMLPYAHPNALVDGYAAAQGLHPTAEATTFWWRVVVYGRDDAAAARSVG
ncbi:MAG: methyltransferase domain-containing protein [Chloroflexi bacterium]|nr:MAG: methyltransferase domain-containing protein [Chloroflexota bacterium]